MTHTAAAPRLEKLARRILPLVLLFTIVGVAGAAPPSVNVSIISPGSGQTLSGAVTWEASAGDASRVDFLVDGSVKWTETVAPWVYNGDGNKLDTTALSNGAHTLSVVAYGKGNKTASASIGVNVNNASAPPPPPPPPPPTTTIGVATKSPAAGATVTGSVPWEATISSGTATRVDFAIDGVTKWTENLSPWVYNGDGNTLDTTTLTNGSHTLKATAVDASGASSSSTVTVTVANGTSPSSLAPPTATAAPAIAGAATVGVALSASAGTWSNTPSAYGYQWQRCDSAGAGCSPVSGATASGYTLTATDQGKTMRVTVTASNNAGSGTSTSAATSLVAATSTSSTPAAGVGSALPSRMPQSSGAGGTYYVDGTNGSDSNSGSAAAPWKTINKALGAVPLNGSIINVLPGTYNSTGTSYVINFSRKASTSDPITLRAQTPGTVIIGNADPNTWTIGGWIHGATGLRLQGLTFRVHATANLNKGADGVLIENSSRIEVSRCTINEVGTIALTVRGGFNNGETSDDVWFIDNVFRSSSSNVFAQVTGTGWSTDQYFGSKGAHWIYAGQYGTNTTWEISNGARRLVITNNVFTGTTAGRDIELGPQAQNSYVVNNTFYGNHPISMLGASTLAAYAGQGVELFANSSNGTYQTGGNVIANNLFVDLDGHAVYGSGPSESGNVVRSNLSYNLRNGEGYQGRTSEDYEPLYGSSVLFTVGANLGDASPAFVDPAGFNFHLGSASPARGVANPSYSYPYDADGAARPAAPAVGAFG